MEKNVKTALQEALFGKTESGHCPVCKGKIGPFKDRLSEKEFRISGMCQGCQDKTFGA